MANVQKQRDRHSVAQCTKCDYTGRVKGAIWHFLKTHVELEKVPFYCSHCHMRGEIFVGVSKHAQAKHRGTDAQVVVSTSPYAVGLSTTHPQNPDLILVKNRGTSSSSTESAEIADDRNEAYNSTAMPSAPATPAEEKNSDQQVLQQALSATVSALAASTDGATIRVTISSIKWQVIATNLNINQVKAMVSSLDSSNRRINNQLNSMIPKIMEQVDLRGPAYTISQAADRIRSAAGSLETSVEGFREGLFNLVQALISEQKIMTTQMNAQAHDFKELIQSMTAASAFNNERNKELMEWREERQGNEYSREMEQGAAEEIQRSEERY